MIISKLRKKLHDRFVKDYYVPAQLILKQENYWVVSIPNEYRRKDTPKIIVINHYVDDLDRGNPDSPFVDWYTVYTRPQPNVDRLEFTKIENALLFIDAIYNTSFDPNYHIGRMLCTWYDHNAHVLRATPLNNCAFDWYTSYHDVEGNLRQACTFDVYRLSASDCGVHTFKDDAAKYLKKFHDKGYITRDQALEILAQS